MRVYKKKHLLYTLKSHFKNYNFEEYVYTLYGYSNLVENLSEKFFPVDL